MAVSHSAQRPQSNEQLRPLAAKECSDRAAPYGNVHIIDVEQRTPVEIIIWGTVESREQRRSFSCSFGTKISAFKMRMINQAR